MAAEVTGCQIIWRMKGKDRRKGLEESLGKIVRKKQGKSAKQSEKKHQREAGINQFMGSVNTLLGASMWC